MAREGRRNVWRAVPLTLALAMLAVVVLAGLLPDTGVVSASSSCTYGKCPAAQPLSLWVVSISVIVVILALIAALLLLRRNRRRPPASSDGTVEAGAGAGAVGGTTGQNWSESQDSGDATWNEGSVDSTGGDSADAEPAPADEPAESS